MDNGYIGFLSVNNFIKIIKYKHICEIDLDDYKIHFYDEIKLKLIIHIDKFNLIYKLFINYFISMNFWHINKSIIKEITFSNSILDLIIPYLEKTNIKFTILNLEKTEKIINLNKFNKYLDYYKFRSITIKKNNN